MESGKLVARCVNCLNEINLDDHTHIKVYQADLDIEETVCSGSCLCELAWRIRESAPKLSKSKQETGQ